MQQLLGMLTEAIHTPFIQDRFLAVQNARYIFNNMKNLGDEIEFVKGGAIEKRAQEVLTEAEMMLAKIEEMGLKKAIEIAMFAEISRKETGGKGLDGVVDKVDEYYNPFLELMKGGQRNG